MSFQESSDASLDWLCPEEETDGVLAAERISRILKASHVLVWVCLLLGDPRKLCLFVLVPFKTDQKRVPSKYYLTSCCLLVSAQFGIVQFPAACQSESVCMEGYRFLGTERHQLRFYEKQQSLCEKCQESTA